MATKITLRKSPWVFYEANPSEDNCELCGNVTYHLPGAYYAVNCLCPDCLHNETGQEWESAIRASLSKRDKGELEEFEAQMIEFFGLRWFDNRNVFYNENTKEIWQH